MADQSILTLANNSGEIDADDDLPTNAEATTTKQSRTRRENRRYEYCDEYQSFDEALERLKLEKIWSHVRVNKGSYGTKYFYRCNLAKFRDKDCAAAAYIYLPADTQTYEIYKTTCKIDACNRTFKPPD